MTILLTGATGFLGKEIQTAFKNSAEIITLGRSEDAMIHCDLSTQIPKLPSPEMVIHAAGKAHIVPKTQAERLDFNKVNVQGTNNLLQGLKNNNSLKKIVFISSVAVYGLFEGTNIKEEAPLLASDAYGESKIAAEKLVINWCISHKIQYYILRLPLIAGKNAPGNLGAMVNGIKKGKYLSIGKGAAVKSIVLASDVAQFIKSIEGASGIYNLSDGYNPSFNELENKIAIFYNKKNPVSLPIITVKLLGIAGDIIGAKFPINSNKIKKITSNLTFDDSKARAALNWNPNEVLKAWEIE